MGVEQPLVKIFGRRKRGNSWSDGRAIRPLPVGKQGRHGADELVFGSSSGSTHMMPQATPAWSKRLRATTWTL